MYSKSGRKGRSNKMSAGSRSQALATRRTYDIPAQIERGYPSMWGALGELKAVDTTMSEDVSTSEIVRVMNACSQGTDIGTRVGRQITMKSVQIRGHIKANNANPGDLVFWAVVYDRQSNGAYPNMSDVYTTDSLVPNFRNLNNRKRFKVLGSGYIKIPTATSLEGNIVPFEFYRKLNHPTEYNATNGGTIADITTGSLLFMQRGYHVAGADDSSIVVYSRVRFSDT